MQILDLNEIKRQCNIDLDYHGDDEYLEMVGNAAEDLICNLTNYRSLDELEAVYGEVPPSVRHAMRMAVDYYYSNQRGSSAESNNIPDAIFLLTQLYRHY